MFVPLYFGRCPRCMITAEPKPELLSPEPLAANIPSVQPGGGICYAIELAWGRCRRWYLRRFRRAYLERMAGLRIGSTDGAPHEVAPVDPTRVQRVDEIDRFLIRCRHEIPPLPGPLLAAET